MQRLEFISILNTY